MRLLLLFCLLSCVGLGLACSRGPGGVSNAAPPVARAEPHEMAEHGSVRVDEYFWLREREDPEVISYLEAENAYTESMMSHVADFETDLYDEIVARIQQNDESVPYRLDDYYYYSRFEKGREYRVYCRKRGTLDGAEEVMLDANELAEGQDYFAVRGNAVSFDQDILAFATDTVGRRIYTIRFRNLTTGEMLPDEITAVTGNLAWANDNRTLFYSRQDPETLRGYQIWRHRLGTDPSKDVLVYQEDDDTFSVGVWRTKSKRFLMIGSFQTVSTEIRYLDADDPAGEFAVFLPRERDHEYGVDHFGDSFFIRTNHEAKNFRLMSTPVNKVARSSWKEVIPHRDDVLLESFEIFRDHLVVAERKDGLMQMRVRPWDGGDEHYLDFGEPAYAAYIGTNPNFDTTVLRYGYTSLTTPNTIYDYDMVSHDRQLMKQDEVLGDFDASNYVTERLHAPARDGVEVPVSLVYRKGTKLDGTSPLLLYGYGSYGYSLDASFRSDRLSLLDRGFVYAIAHVRGGEELGRQWYEDGKLLKKMNTFHDFIDCGEFLVERRYSAPDRLYAMGGSAGGLLMGAIINMRPGLFHGVVAAVPFVDVMTTMLDDSIPLTTSEYDEWGNPNEKEYYNYMLSYSPYDNVKAMEYPHMLVTTGLHDSQVQYWEPAKWVAKLRTLKTDDNRLLLKTNMDAGHGGASGRFRRYREIATNYAFLLDLAGIRD